MRRILLVETASPKRVRKKADEILRANSGEGSDLIILCRDDPHSMRELEGLEGAQIIPWAKAGKREALRRLRAQAFDVVYAFWTGESRYRRMKLAALRIPAGRRDIDIGDGHVFQLTSGNFARFLRIRWKYPRPSDHLEFVARSAESESDAQKAGPEADVAPFAPMPSERSASRAPADVGQSPAEEPAAPSPAPAEPEPFKGEKILILQSAEPEYLLSVMEKLMEQPLFREPRYTLFCRDRLEAVERLADHPLLYRVITHSETRGAFKHWRVLRRAQYDAVVALFTGDPGYWKIKCFSFLLGARHKVIFNENLDCFYFSWKAWLSHLSYRLARRGGGRAESPWATQGRAVAIGTTKIVLLPFRFLWLLLVWIWLRSSRLRAVD